MSKPLDALLDLLDLEQIEVDIFRGRSPEGERRQRVFGGQVAGQALVAAGRTVPADQAAPDYIRDKVAQTTAERMADKAAKAERAAQAAGPDQHAPQAAPCAPDRRASDEAPQHASQRSSHGASGGEGQQ